MRWSDIQFDPTRKTLRQFTGLWLAFFGALAIWHGLVRGRTVLALVLGLLALAGSLLGLIRPELMRFIYVGWMVLAFPIGWTISQLMLVTMFFGLFAPIGLVFRFLGRDPLQRTRQPELKSYWVPKPAPADLRSYFKQF
jgi:Saxitoxin biosynthesis operon protein SxtJ